MEACNKIDSGNRVICVKGDVMQNFYLIRVENTKMNKIITKNGLHYVLKQIYCLTPS
ncbi:GHKL domain-containing protein [Clostridioides difficile]|uniref:GHKL domain-containing protein n=1 Tax=Clostridioides difficile TaxID=1496 RepID=UPI003F8D29EA